MKRKLIEQLQFTLVVDPNVGIVADNAVAEWSGVEYPQLSVLLTHTKFLALIHQTHHWQTKGDPFYGDHLLFQRLYEGVSAEVDAIAEKAVGLGSIANVDPMMQTAQLFKLVQGYGMTSTIPQPSELARRSFLAEVNFLKVVDLLVTQMREMGTLTRGLDNLLAGIEDVHEGHVYLLKQRCEG
jgi:hypothetical protein